MATATTRNPCVQSRPTVAFCLSRGRSARSEPLGLRGLEPDVGELEFQSWLIACSAACAARGTASRQEAERVRRVAVRHMSQGCVIKRLVLRQDDPPPPAQKK